MSIGYGIIFVRQDGETAPVNFDWAPMDEDQAQDICNGLNAQLSEDAEGMYYPMELHAGADPSMPVGKFRKPRAV